MKRVSLVAVLGMLAVAGGTGCKGCAGADLGDAPPINPAARDDVRTSAGAMLYFYGEVGDAADMKYLNGHDIELSGLVRGLSEERGRLRVSFESDDPKRAVSCRVDAAQAGAVGKLVPGQLVVMQGIALGRQAGGDPTLDKCRVAWAGPTTQAEPQAQEELRAARSLAVCRVPLAVDRLRREVGGAPGGVKVTEAGWRQQEPEKAARFAAAEKPARAALTEASQTALSCSHPLLLVLERCETGSEPERQSPECASPYVKRIRALLGS